jgi:hypothetical protein
VKEEKVTGNEQFLSLHIASQLAVAIVVSYGTAEGY